MLGGPFAGRRSSPSVYRVERSRAVLHGRARGIQQRRCRAWVIHPAGLLCRTLRSCARPRSCSLGSGVKARNRDGRLTGGGGGGADSEACGSGTAAGVTEPPQGPVKATRIGDLFFPTVTSRLDPVVGCADLRPCRRAQGCCPLVPSSFPQRSSICSTLARWSSCPRFALTWSPVYRLKSMAFWMDFSFCLRKPLHRVLPLTQPMELKCHNSL